MKFKVLKLKSSTKFLLDLPHTHQSLILKKFYLPANNL